MEVSVNREVPLFGVLRGVTPEQEEKRYHDFILSSEAVDRHNTVFRTEGWELDNYNNTNPVVSYVHEDNNADPDLIIGTSRVFIEDGKVIGRLFYEPEDINPMAEKIRKKVNHGTLRMASIAAIPKKGHFGKEENGEKRDVLYFDKQELLAWSIVPVGSNREALKRSATAFEEIKKEFSCDVPNFIKGGIVHGKSVLEGVLERTIQRNKIRNIEVTTEPEPEKKLLSIREAQLIINNH